MEPDTEQRERVTLSPINLEGIRWRSRESDRKKRNSLSLNPITCLCVIYLCLVSKQVEPKLLEKSGNQFHRMKPFETKILTRIGRLMGYKSRTKKETRRKTQEENIRDRNIKHLSLRFTHWSRSGDLSYARPAPTTTRRPQIDSTTHEKGKYII